MRLICLSLCGLGLLLQGCNSATGSYQSNAELAESMTNSRIIQRAVEYEGPLRNPVIVIHGYLGAKLKNYRNGKLVWGEFSTWDYFTGLSDSSIRDLALKMNSEGHPADWDDDVRAYAFLEDVRVLLFGLPVNLNAYEDMLSVLRDAGYVQVGRPMPPGKNFPTLFPFYYDWRRDLPSNAARLHRYILERRAELQAEYEKRYGLKDYDVQFDIVSHSMGGLLSRYYLRYGDADLPADGESLPELTWKGSKFIDKLLIVGTPNAGYLDTFLELLNGLRVAPGTALYPPAVIGTFATIYQMMPVQGFRSVLWKDDPNGGEVDIFDPGLWVKMRWGLADPSQDKYLKVMMPEVTGASERRRIALSYQAYCLKRARQFTLAMQVKARPPEDVAMFLFAGAAFPTSRTVLVDRASGKVEVSEYAPGDGKILVTSANYDLREDGYWTPYLRSPITWDGVYLLNAAHMGITRSSMFSTNAFYCMMIKPSVKLDKRDKHSVLNHGELPQLQYLGEGQFGEDGKPRP